MRVDFFPKRIKRSLMRYANGRARAAPLLYECVYTATHPGSARCLPRPLYLRGLISRLHHCESTQTHPPRTSQPTPELTLLRPPEVKVCLCLRVCHCPTHLYQTDRRGKEFSLFCFLKGSDVNRPADCRLAHLLDCNMCRPRPCLYLLFKH